MLFQTLASQPFRRLTLLLCITTTFVGVAHAQASAADPTISKEILNFVPTCAQSCFQAFILANFGASGCGNSPSMPCLCTKTGASGHTIGEGAMACVVAEGQRGICGGEDTESEFSLGREGASGSCANAGWEAEKVSTAYNMCVGVANAAPKTHSTIVATMIVPPGTAPSSTTSTTSPARDLTTSVPAPSVPDVVTPTPATTAPSDTGAAVAPETDGAAVESKPRLNPAQIAGIVIGCLAVIVFGILLVFLAKCVRRKRFPDTEAAGGFTKMRDSLSFGGRKSAANSPPQLQISKPMVDPSLNLVGYPWQTTTPMAGTTQVAPSQRSRTPQPLGVGLALSPHRRAPSADAATIRSVQRSTPALVLTPPRHSRTQTPKIENVMQQQQRLPTLTLAIPAAGPKKLPVPPPVASNARDSIVTEFAEDGEGESATGTASNIWRPPPTDPQSATTYYSADKNGNWILRNRKSELVEPPLPAVPMPPPAAVTANAELPSPEDQTKSERAQGFSGWFSPGAVVPPLRVPSREHATKLGSPIAFRKAKEDQPQPQPQTLQAPSRRDIRTSSVYSPYPNGPVSILPGPSNPLPAPSTRTTPAPTKSRRRSRRNSRGAGGRRLSTDSSTSIESAAFNEDGDEDDLSPVAESPVSPISPGQSPVSYPPIPTHNQQPRMPIKPYGLPANPQARKMNNTISTMPPPRSGPGQVRTGSPAQRPPFELSGEDVRPQQAGQGYHRPRPQQGQGQYQPFRPPPQQQRPAPQPLQHRRLSSSDHQQREWYPSPAQTQQVYGAAAGVTRTLSPAIISAGMQGQQGRYPGPAVSARTQSSDVLLPGMMGMQDQGQQSSLAKRRGADGKVVGLALGGGGGEGRGGARKNVKGWERSGAELVAPPVTPGIRMMTPTRKGEDLFLYVGL